MPRAPTTLDPFNAVAEPRRRELLGVLADSGGEMAVNALVERLGWTQPQVSKHLGVLRQVGLVSAERRGRARMYRIHAERIKPIHDWAAIFEKYWDRQLARIKAHAEAKASATRRDPHGHERN